MPHLSDRQLPPLQGLQSRSARALALIEELGLLPHPEGGWYREVFRSTDWVQPADARPARSAVTTIDFLLEAGQFSAWHRVLSDEVWHLLEGTSLTLWLHPGGTPADAFDSGLLRPQSVLLSAATTRRHVVPAGWWQAAEPGPAFAYVGATVAPGFEFSDFAFGRDDASLCQALAAQAPALQRLL